MISEMNTFDYWVNWRFLMCAIVVLFPMIVASILIRKYEGSDATKHDNGETLQETTGALYEDECWRPCLKGIHPAWLLGFHILAFSMLLALLIIKVVVHRGSIYFYYTHLVVCSLSMDAISLSAPMVIRPLQHQIQREALTWHLH